MGLFSRLGTLFRSNINELINKAEDPEKMLNQVLVDMKGQLVEAKKQVAVAIADEKRIKKQLDQERAKANDWERKAMLAIKAGDDGLARAALQRKNDHEEVAKTLEVQWEAQKDSVEKLKEALRGLDHKIEEAKRKRNILVSRKKRAEAQRMINETLARSTRRAPSTPSSAWRTRSPSSRPSPRPPPSSVCCPRPAWSRSSRPSKPAT